MSIYQLEISTGTLNVYDNRVVITHKIPLERDGYYERIIPIKSIKAIQFRSGGKKGGYLQFIIPGCNASDLLSGGAETVKDNNAVVFGKSESETAEQIKNYLVKRITE